MHCNDWILQISKCQSVKFANQIVFRRICFFPKSVIHVGWQALSMKLILRTAINLNVQYCWSFPVSQEDLALGTEIYLGFKICVSPTEEATRLFLWILPGRQSDKFGNCNYSNYEQHTTTSWWQQQRYDRYERLEKIYNFSLETLNSWLASIWKLDSACITWPSLSEQRHPKNNRLANKEQRPNNSFIV